MNDVKTTKFQLQTEIGNVLGFSFVVLLDTASWQKHLQINIRVYKPLIAVHRIVLLLPFSQALSPPLSPLPEMGQSRNNFFYHNNFRSLYCILGYFKKSRK